MYMEYASAGVLTAQRFSNRSKMVSGKIIIILKKIRVYIVKSNKKKHMDHTPKLPLHTGFTIP